MKDTTPPKPRQVTVRRVARNGFGEGLLAERLELNRRLDEIQDHYKRRRRRIDMTYRLAMGAVWLILGVIIALAVLESGAFK